jgi:CBS domain-containing protein
VLEGGALVGIVTTSDLLVAIVGPQAAAEPSAAVAEPESSPARAAAAPRYGSSLGAVPLPTQVEGKRC